MTATSNHEKAASRVGHLARVWKSARGKRYSEKRGMAKGDGSSAEFCPPCGNPAPFRKMKRGLQAASASAQSRSPELVTIPSSLRGEADGAPPDPSRPAEKAVEDYRSPRRSAAKPSGPRTCPPGFGLRQSSGALGRGLRSDDARSFVPVQGFKARIAIQRNLSPLKRHECRAPNSLCERGDENEEDRIASWENAQPSEKII
jgi:hypothetical protein